MSILDSKELQRYSRHLPVIGIEGQEKLKQAKVLCIGAGGLGSPALQYLAASGIGTLGIMDADQVELSNLQRQILFREQDIGRNKAVVIKEQLSQLNSKTLWNVYQEFITIKNAQQIIESYDVVLDASDNYPTRYLLNEVCRLLQKPLISASIFQFEAQLSVFNYQKGPCYQCLYPSPPPDTLSPNCSLAGVLGVLPGIAGCLQSIEAIKVILGYNGVLSGTLLSMDLITMQFKHYEINQTDCSTHPLIRPAENTHDKVFSFFEITAHDLALSIESNQENLQLLDVRESYERAICHLGGLHIPLSTFSPELIAQSIDNSKPLIVYCKSGIRSAHACEQLVQAGFSKVYNLQGGILSWINNIDNSLTLY